MITDSPLSTAREAKLVPASFAQARLWFLHRLDPERSDYNVAVGWRIAGQLDVARLRDAMQVVVDRHEILRTTFVDVDGAPWQRISASLELEIPVCDLRSVPAPMRELKLARCLAEEASRPFDLARGPLMRVTVFQIDEESSALVIAKHHTICGGDSGRITTYELAVAYDALVARDEPRLPTVETQHADYTAWQHEQLTPERETELVAYWRDRLAGAPASLALPTDFRRPRVRSSAGTWATFRISNELARALHALADAAGVTLHMTLLAAFQVLLGRHAEQDDVLVGSPVSARARGQFRNLMGFLVNVVIHRGDLTGDPTFRELLARTLASARAAYAHRDLPLERVIESVPVKRDPGRNPLFQVMFTMQEADSSPLDLAGLQCEPIRLRNAAAKVDLSLLLYSDDHGFAGELEYSTDLFAAPTIERMAAQYVRLLEEAVLDPDRRLSELPLISAEERQRIVVGWNDTASAYPAGRSIPSLFREQAHRAPDAVAIVDGSRSLTYAALERRAIELARRLRERGIAGADRVGVCIERSQEEIVAFLGILFAGCAYVPLDPSHPPERLAAILDEAGATGLVTTSQTPRAVAEVLAQSRRPVVVIDDDVPEPDAGRDFTLPETLDDTLAYVMYTSGSTGMPKGVAIPHRAIARLVCGTDYVQLGPTDTVAHLSNPAFDAATFEIWGPLLNGGRIAVIPRDAVMSMRSLADALDRHSVSALFLTTALFNQVAQDVPSALRGRVVLFGGEPAEPWCVGTALREGRPSRLLHMYGPTEATTFATWHEVRAVHPDAATVPIGRPVANTTVYLLDANGAPVAPGIAGEIHIGGPGVAAGYMAQSAFTTERFVADVFVTTPGARLYRTGDYARMNGDGDLEFIGRADRQVKIRGYRIEPAEVEAAIARLPGVKESVVAMHGDTSDTRRLNAYVVPANGAQLVPEDLWDDLRRTLPDYMVPAGIVLLRALPMTSSGKVDRAALPDPVDLVEQRKGARVAPRDPLEYAIASIWQELLGAERISIHDDFFDIGGHSLLAARMMDRVERACGVGTSLVTLLHEPTIAHLADMLRAENPVSPATATVVNALGNRPPVFFLHGDLNGGGYYSRGLARALGADQPFYALHPHGLDGQAIPDTIDAMADERLQALRAVRPTGPYFLAGYCNGGYVAIEMARKLVAAGERVPVVVVIDALAPVIAASRRMPAATLNTRDTVEAQYWRVMSAHNPRTYRGKLVVMRSESMRSMPACLGWSKIAPHAETRSIAGDHFGVITRDVATTAARLRACLDSAHP